MSAQTATTTLQLVSVHGSLPMHFQPPISVFFTIDIHQLHQNDNRRTLAATTEEIGVMAWIAAAVLCAFGPFLITRVFFFVYKYRWLSHTTIQE